MTTDNATDVGNDTVLDDYAHRVNRSLELVNLLFNELKDLERIDVWRISRRLIDIAAILQGEPLD